MSPHRPFAWGIWDRRIGSISCRTGSLNIFLQTISPYGVAIVVAIEYPGLTDDRDNESGEPNTRQSLGEWNTATRLNPVWWYGTLSLRTADVAVFGQEEDEHQPRLHHCKRSEELNADLPPMWITHLVIEEKQVPMYCLRFWTCLEVSKECSLPSTRRRSIYHWYRYTATTFYEGTGKSEGSEDFQIISFDGKTPWNLK